MRFALLVYEDLGASQHLPDAERRALAQEYHALSKSPGVVAHSHLPPRKSTTVVRVQDGQTVTTEGPLSDTKEQLRGFYLLESDDGAAAVALAASIPAARTGGAVEVSPLEPH